MVESGCLVVKALMHYRDSGYPRVMDFSLLLRQQREY